MLPTELSRVDAVLAEDRFLVPFRRRLTATTGRPTIPIETYLRRPPPDTASRAVDAQPAPGGAPRIGHPTVHGDPAEPPPARRSSDWSARSRRWSRSSPRPTCAWPGSARSPTGASPSSTPTRARPRAAARAGRPSSATRPRRRHRRRLRDRRHPRDAAAPTDGSLLDGAIAKATRAGMQLTHGLRRPRLRHQHRRRRAQPTTASATRHPAPAARRADRAHPLLAPPLPLPQRPRRTDLPTKTQGPPPHPLTKPRRRSDLGRPHRPRPQPPATRRSHSITPGHRTASSAPQPAATRDRPSDRRPPTRFSGGSSG